MEYTILQKDIGMRTSTTASELDHEILQQGSEASGAAHSASANDFVLLLAGNRAGCSYS